MTYTVHEPFPTYQSAMGFGRGGAGNRTPKIIKPSLPTPTAVPATPTPGSTSLRPPASSSSQSSTAPLNTSADTGGLRRNKMLANTAPPPTHTVSSFPTGRGGAGNMHASSEERAIFHFDEELEARNRQVQTGRLAPIHHVGRGGSGNKAREKANRERERELELQAGHELQHLHRSRKGSFVTNTTTTSSHSGSSDSWIKKNKPWYRSHQNRPSDHPINDPQSEGIRVGVATAYTTTPAPAPPTSAPLSQDGESKYQLSFPSHPAVTASASRASTSYAPAPSHSSARGAGNTIASGGNTGGHGWMHRLKRNKHAKSSK